MRARIVIVGAGIGSVTLVLAVMCVVMAQGPARTRSATLVPSNHPHPPAARFVVPASQPTTAVSDAPSRALPPSTFEAADLSSPMLDASASTKPAIIELRSGLKLEGQLVTGPIPCQVMFGEASLPLETIRGIRMSDELVSDEGGQARPTSATIVLENGDSLTGMPRLEVIHLQTEWGEAAVKLTHLKSLVLTSESLMWQAHEGRWRLIPIELPPSTADGSAESDRSELAPPDTTVVPPAAVPQETAPGNLLPPSEIPAPTVPTPADRELPPPIRATKS